MRQKYQNFIGSKKHSLKADIASDDYPAVVTIDKENVPNFSNLSTIEIKNFKSPEYKKQNRSKPKANWMDKPQKLDEKHLKHIDYINKIYHEVIVDKKSAKRAAMKSKERQLAE